MYTHDITGCNFYNIYIYICEHIFNLRNFYRNCYFLQLYTYKFRKLLCNSIHIYVIYIMQ